MRQVGASGWFVRLNLFARSQNRPFGGLAVIKDIQRNLNEASLSFESTSAGTKSVVIEYIGRVCVCGILFFPENDCFSL